MALVEDLSVKLKNRDSQTTDFDDIRQFRVPRSDGGYGLFTNLNSLRSYFIKPTEMENVWEVLNAALFSAGGFSSGNAAVVSVGDGEWDDTFSYEQDGKRHVTVILTPKNLTIGGIYNINDI